MKNKIVELIAANVEGLTAAEIADLMNSAKTGAW